MGLLLDQKIQFLFQVNNKYLCQVAFRPTQSHGNLYYGRMEQISYLEMVGLQIWSLLHNREWIMMVSDKSIASQMEAPDLVQSLPLLTFPLLPIRHSF